MHAQATIGMISWEFKCGDNIYWLSHVFNHGGRVWRTFKWCCCLCLP